MSARESRFGIHRATGRYLRRAAARVDSEVLGGRVRRVRGWKARRARISLLEKLTSEAAYVGFAGGPPLLDDLCDRYGSDKGGSTRAQPRFGWPVHNYTHVYALLFDHCRANVKLVFECGIGSTDPTIPANMSANGQPGASLRVWRDYFPSAEIIGADIDPKVLFSEERVQTYLVDQTSPCSIEQMWEQVGRTGFDLMIDDGLHDASANICMFDNSIRHLSDHGLYVIEDVADDAIEYITSQLASRGYTVMPVTLSRGDADQVGGNNLILCRKP